MKPPLQVKIEAFLVLNVRRMPVVKDFDDHPKERALVLMGDESDGRGPFITYWNEAVLGPWPTVADGFSVDELRWRDKGKAQSRGAPR
jgi:hypothetical protein